MKIKMKMFLMILVSVLANIFWIIGLIYADYKYFIVGLIITSLLGIFVIKNFKELEEFKKDDGDGNVMEDERDDLINQKANNMSFSTMIAIIVISGIGLITLRNIYPEYELIGYVLILLVILSAIINEIAKFYYKRVLG